MNSPLLKAMVLYQVLLFAVFAGAGWSAGVPAAATPGAVERSLAPKPLPEPSRLPEMKIEEEGAPALGAAAITFQLKSVVFAGNTIFTSEQLQKVVAGYIGQKMEVGKLAEIADAVTAYYKEEGYFLTRAYLPPQTIKDGQVLIRIREGRLGEIIIKGNQRYRQELLNNTLKIIREQGAVRTADVERGLLLLMDYPGLSVKATFKPGSAPGTTDIVLEVTEGRFFDVSLDYDNFGSAFVSRNRYGASLDLNNLTGWGDSLALHGVTGDRGFDGLFYGRVAYALPLGYSGTKLGLNYTYLKYKLGQELSVLDAGGESNAGGVSLSYPLIRSRKVNWFLQGGFNITDVSQKIAGNTSGKDRLRFASLGTTWQYLDSLEGSNTVSLRGYRSFEKILGGMDKGDPDTIRINSDVVYSKVELDLSRIQRLPAGFSLLLNGTGQWAGDRLPSSEEFHLGGAGTVRGYAQGERSGDKGYAVTAELRIPLLGLQDERWFGKPVGEMVQLAAFYDYGKVWITDAAQNGEQALDGIDMHGAGAGLRFNYSPWMRLKVDWAKSVGGQDPLDTSDKDNGIWLVQAVLSF